LRALRARRVGNRARNSRQARHVESTKTTWRSIMFRGALLWMIGIPLPIILILFFLGYLS
jgi:hypothetical protein